MNFKYKAGAQWVFSILPYGNRINLYFQKKYGSFFFTEKHLNDKKRTVALKEALLTSTDKEILEIGAGWDLLEALLLSNSARNITTIDYKKNIDFQLVNNSIKSTHTTIKQVHNIEDLAIHYNLKYLAPLPHTKLPFVNNQFDFAYSTVAFEYFKPKNLSLHLSELRRCLKPEATFFVIIDYQDHWSFFDKNISIYNYLKYSKFEWFFYNPPLNYQNRLRHSDYILMFEQAGFRIKKVSIEKPTVE